MQNHLLIIIVVLSSITISYGQKVVSFNEKLSWFKRDVSTRLNNSKQEVLSFDNAVFDHESKSPVRYVKKIKLPFKCDIDVIITPMEWIASSYSNLVPKKVKNYNLELEIVEERNEFYAFISFIPIKYEGSQLLLLEDFKLDVSIKNKHSNSYRGPTFKSVSALADGNIYKILIRNSGLYRLDYNFLTNSLGIPAASITTSSIKIYGSRGGLLPEALSIERIDDLVEIPYLLEGGDDSSFDAQDAIIFYGEGGDTYKVIDNKKIFEKNIYGNENYFFLKVNSDVRSQIGNSPNAQMQEEKVSFFQDYQHYEEDKTNLLGAFGSAQGSGKQWFGDVFSVTRSRDYSDKFNLNGKIEESLIELRVAFAGRSSKSHDIHLKVGPNNFTQSISSVNTSNIEARYARNVLITESVTINSENLPIIIEYPSNGDNEGWLDYIEIKVKKELKYNGIPFTFVNDATIENEATTYSVEGSNKTVVWDITDPLVPKRMNTSYSGSSVVFSVKNENKLREFLVFEVEDIVNNPEAIGRIANQNLHGIKRSDLVIVYYKAFLPAAEQLKSHRESQGITTQIIDVDQIFNEFSGGKKDPVSIRDFSKMLYERDPNYRYLLLLGDGSYDYRNIVPGLPDHNFIPVYETDESLHPIEAFPSDDFYALLSDFEGDDLRGQLELAVGRIPAKTLKEAEVVVDKIIRYESDPNTFGDWRLRIGFTADDEDSNTHLNQAERIAQKTEAKYKLFNQQKVYFDAYQQESTPGGARYPLASKALSDNIFKGQLALNYLGHGGPRGWAQERVLQVNDILSWDNYNKMPLVITATCSFTGYDDPGLISAGEYALLSEKGGAIGLMTTVRAVYSLENERLTASVFDTIFSYDNDVSLTIGEIIQRAKNNNWQDTARINARKFALIGDPSMKLALPKLRIQTTSINGKPVDNVINADTLGALQRVTITGIITDTEGNKINDFNGTVFPTIFDKKSRLNTLANDARSRVTDFSIHKSVIYKGAATAVNGAFKFEFIVPKDIDYTIGNGRISYYAINQQATIDAAGSFNTFSIGGSSSDIVVDETGPEIKLSMNNEDFVYGGHTTSDPILLVDLYDENGINVTGNSIGHDLVATLDGDEKNSYLLNEFYVSATDDYKNGKVRFPLKNIPPGRHTLTVKAWDVANNSSESLIEFVVREGEDMEIKNVYNFPNPFSTNTQFMFEHAMEGSELDILIHIYTLSGKVVKTIEENILSNGFRINNLNWDGRDDFGDKIGKGIYLYKIKVTDRQFNVTEESDFQKLAIIH
jgi:hypothetical protein